MKAVVVPMVFEVLRTVSDELKKHLKRTEISLVVPCLQKTALLGTPLVPRRVLDISELR